MTRWLTAHLVACLAFVAGGCGTGAEDPSARDVATGSNRQARPPQSRDGLASSADSPTSPQMRPATLAERLRAIKAAGEAAVWLEVRYDDGSVTGWLQDHDVEIGRRRVKLSQIRRLTFRPKPGVELSDGVRVEGKFESLQEIAMTIGGTPHRLDLSRAVEVLIAAPYKDIGKPGPDALLRGIFADPLPSNSGLTSATIVSFPGSAFQGTTTPSEKDYVVSDVDHSGSGVSLSLKLRTMAHLPYVRGGSVELGAPFGQEFGVSEYETPLAAATFLNLIDGCPKLDTPGRFVVWEYERNGDKINRLAIDFYLHVSCTTRNETWCGRIRYNSSFR